MGGMSEDHDRCFSILLSGHFRQVFSTPIHYPVWSDGWKLISSLLSWAPYGLTCEMLRFAADRRNSCLLRPVLVWTRASKSSTELVFGIIIGCSDLAGCDEPDKIVKWEYDDRGTNSGSGCPLQAGTGHGRPGRAPGRC